MTATTERREIVAGVDPLRNWHLAVAWAADEAHRRHLGLRLVSVVTPPPDAHHGRRPDHAREHTHEPSHDTAHHRARQAEAREILHTAAAWAGDRRPGLPVTTALLDGAPARVLAGLSHEAAMVVLGSRHLSRTEEFLSAGSLVVPVTAQARCPVVVVGDAEHTTQDPPYLAVGVDGSASSRAALALAFEEADLRGCALRAVAVWQPPVFSFHTGEELFHAERRLLAETTAGWAEKYPDVRLTHEVLVGSPVERLAEAAEHALALVLGRRGQGGYTGMRVGSVVHGLLHRAHCPVITVPVG
ncbi:universal stress protein [Streptomyces sp. NPDC048623]|uniref:universal stress protein n=1 Tax=Streptomyces sp. NPDC048623 TaxID=3155761 RepID=UPI003449E545